ncbi:MAG: MobA/MobL family protein [Bacteroidales bacterium]|nr:MobA/MobL family protein [Bacteroidales bacterium]
MAIYHLSIKIISRGNGKSAVAAAAYRAGEKIKNEYDGIEHDYTKKGGIVHTEILLPNNAPSEYADRAVLWNAVEKVEKARNSQLAREIEIALPVELSKEENIILVRDYVKQHFVEQGMCADIAIHDTGTGNPHAHILLTMRPFEKSCLIDPQDGRNVQKSGEWGAKSKKEYILDNNGEKIRLKSGEYKSRKVPAVDWSEQTKAEEWRAAWADTANRYLEKLNRAERIDHRSYERQGIEQIPTIHLGAAASQMERKGISTNRGDINREIEVSNQKLRQLKARLVKLQGWLKEEMANTEPPTLADVISNILERWSGIGSLKAAANMLNFLTRNNIMDMAGLDNYFKSMIGKQFDIRDELKPINRRLNTLDEHLRHCYNFKNCRGHKSQYEKLYAEYVKLKKERGFGAGRKAQKALDVANAYYENNCPQITMYKDAERYLRNVLQTHFNPKKSLPVTKWKAEREKLLADKQRLNREYQTLKSDISEVEKIRRTVYDILSAERRRTQPERSWGREL